MFSLVLYLLFQCLTFWYHMQGAAVGSLNVYLKVGSQSLGQPRWTRNSAQGGQWIKGSVSINDNIDYAVIIDDYSNTFKRCFQTILHTCCLFCLSEFFNHVKRTIT